MRTIVLVAVAGCAAPPAAATLSEIQQQVFTPTCSMFSSCHQSAAAAAMLDLEDGKSYAALVNVSATGVSGRTRVKPGDPDGSYLMEKLTKAMPAAGVQMPNNGDPLPSAQLDMVRSWIQDGAKNN